MTKFAESTLAPVWVLFCFYGANYGIMKVPFFWHEKPASPLRVFLCGEDIKNVVK